LLRERDVEFDIIDYKKTGLTASDLATILDALPDTPGALVRKDKQFAALGLNEEQFGDDADRSLVIETLVAHPEIMQRPIGVLAGRAVIARPSDLIFELLAD
jgi:arsenate reductase